MHWSGLTTICGTLVRSWLVWHSSIIYFLSIQKHRLWSSIKTAWTLSSRLPSDITELQMSRHFFVTCSLDTGYLQLSGASSSTEPRWHAAKQFAKCLLCANDVTERGLALIQELNTSTHDDEQRHCFEEHRKKFPFLRILWLTFHFCKYCFLAN